MPAARLALASIIVFFVVVFGWRSWLQYRRTGDRGFRVFSRPVGRAEGVALLLMVVGGKTAVMVPILTMAGVIRPVAFLPSQVAGFLAIALGLVITVAAQLHMGNSWRVGVGTREVTTLITGGLFRYLRNPIFTGVLTALAGLVLMLPHALSLFALVMVAVGLEVHVRLVEEPYLLRTHGERYREYGRSAGRFVPWVGYLP